MQGEAGFDSKIKSGSYSASRPISSRMSLGEPVGIPFSLKQEIVARMESSRRASIKNKGNFSLKEDLNVRDMDESIHRIFEKKNKREQISKLDKYTYEHRMRNMRSDLEAQLLSRGKVKPTMGMFDFWDSKHQARVGKVSKSVKRTKNVGLDVFSRLDEIYKAVEKEKGKEVKKARLVEVQKAGTENREKTDSRNYESPVPSKDESSDIEKEEFEETLKAKNRGKMVTYSIEKLPVITESRKSVRGSVQEKRQKTIEQSKSKNASRTSREKNVLLPTLNSRKTSFSHYENEVINNPSNLGNDLTQRNSFYLKLEKPRSDSIIPDPTANPTSDHLQNIKIPVISRETSIQKIVKSPTKGMGINIPSETKTPYLLENYRSSPGSNLDLLTQNQPQKTPRNNKEQQFDTMKNTNHITSDVTASKTRNPSFSNLNNLLPNDQPTGVQKEHQNLTSRLELDKQDKPFAYLDLNDNRDENNISLMMNENEVSSLFYRGKGSMVNDSGIHLKSTSRRQRDQAQVEDFLKVNDWIINSCRSLAVSQEKKKTKLDFLRSAIEDFNRVKEEPRNYLMQQRKKRRVYSKDQIYDLEYLKIAIANRKKNRENGDIVI